MDCIQPAVRSPRLAIGSLNFAVDRIGLVIGRLRLESRAPRFSTRPSGLSGGPHDLIAALVRQTIHLVHLEVGRGMELVVR